MMNFHRRITPIESLLNILRGKVPAQDTRRTGALAALIILPGAIPVAITIVAIIVLKRAIKKIQ